jgi:hypothetical protein
MANPEFRIHRVLTRTDIPSPPVPGKAYFVADEGVIVLRLTNDTYEDYGRSGGGGGDVVDDLSGNQTDKAPSVRIIKLALGGKADLDPNTTKLVLSQLPDLNLMYRGAYTGPDAPTAEAALNAAHPTDDLGAYASVIVAGDPSLYIWNGTAWVNSGVSGVWVENINGKTGPVVVLTASDIGAAPESHVADTSVHLVTGDRALLDGLPTTLAGKEDTANKGVANGYAPLGADSKVPEANLPDIDGGNASG